MSQSKEFDALTIAVFSGKANPTLAQEITRHLHVQMGRADVGRFSDGEVSVELMENVRGRDVFIVQSTNPPAENLMELLMMTDACRRASAKRITAVVPYFGYGRQDRRPRATRVAITAKLVANMIASAGVDRLLTVDLHADQIQGFFDIPVDNLVAAPLFSRDIQKRYEGRDLMIVSPDVGGVVRARLIATRLNCDLAIIDKRRERAGVSEVMNIIGDVEGRACILIDDIVDSAGTLCNAAVALVEAGASSVRAYTTHGVLSGGAVARIAAAPMVELVTTNSIQATEAVAKTTGIRQLTVAPLIAEAIRRITEDRSVSSLFD
jgi:ribose-phosphate pyrophosphokinase